jgi:hypothetical protein
MSNQAYNTEVGLGKIIGSYFPRKMENDIASAAD